MPTISVVLAVVFLCLCQIVTVFGAAFLLRRYVESKQAEIESRLNAELAKLVAGEPCQSGAVLSAVGQLIGAEAGRSVKASLMADLSHIKRAANSAAVDGAIEQIGESQPALAGMLSGLGKNKAKGVLNNPLVQILLSRFMSGNSTSGNGGPPTAGPPKSFSL